jgi:hypothetical protein
LSKSATSTAHRRPPSAVRQSIEVASATQPAAAPAVARERPAPLPPHVVQDAEGKRRAHLLDGTPVVWSPASKAWTRADGKALPAELKLTNEAGSPAFRTTAKWRADAPEVVALLAEANALVQPLQEGVQSKISVDEYGILRISFREATQGKEFSLYAPLAGLDSYMVYTTLDNVRVLIVAIRPGFAGVAGQASEAKPWGDLLPSVFFPVDGQGKEKSKLEGVLTRLVEAWDAQQAPEQGGAKPSQPASTK